MRRFYLLLAIIGTVVPYGFFVPYFAAEGLGLRTLLSALFANAAAGGVTADILLSSVVFWIWVVRSRTPRPWLFVLLNLCIGLSCALPAYLYVREGHSEPVVT